jgi:membrane protease YdiL (CAAX protease family)
VFYYGKNIWLNILVHFLNNGLAVTLMYIQLHQGHKTLKEIVNSSSSTGLDFYYLLIAAVVFVYLFLRFKKVSEQEVLNQDIHRY